MPNSRNNGGPRPPRLTLGIPPSPNARPVNQQNGEQSSQATQDIPLPRPSGRPALPQLRIATPMGNQRTPHEDSFYGSSNYPVAGSSDGGGSDHSIETRSTASSYSALSFAMGLRQPAGGTPDPSSTISSEGGVSMEREGSVNSLLPDLDKLSLEKGRPLDVEDLDDEGWLAASEQKKIIELGSLGEGAGGAVSRCKLKDGKTIFALKVCSDLLPFNARHISDCLVI